MRGKNQDRGRAYLGKVEISEGRCGFFVEELLRFLRFLVWKALTQWGKGEVLLPILECELSLESDIKEREPEKIEREKEEEEKNQTCFREGGVNIHDPGKEMLICRKPSVR